MNNSGFYERLINNFRLFPWSRQRKSNNVWTAAADASHLLLDDRLHLLFLIRYVAPHFCSFLCNSWITGNVDELNKQLSCHKQNALGIIKTRTQYAFFLFILLCVFLYLIRGQSNLTKSASRGPIARLVVTPGGRKLYRWIPGVGFPISVP